MEQENPQDLGLIRVDNTSKRHKNKVMTVRYASAQHALTLQEWAVRGSYRSRCVMATLTYANPDDFKIGHITEYINRVRALFYKQGFAEKGFEFLGVWVIETVSKGSRAYHPHYHVLFFLPHGFRLPQPDTSGQWPWGSSNIVVIKKSASSYISKYMAKESYRHLPKGLRSYGVFGLSAVSRAKLAWRKLPQYVRDVFGLHEKPKRVAASGIRPAGFVSDTGGFIASDYALFDIFDNCVYLYPKDKSGHPFFLDNWTIHRLNKSEFIAWEDWGVAYSRHWF